MDITTPSEAGTAEDSGLYERYHRLVELSPDGILIHDDDTILMANPAALRLAGASDRSELVGRPITTFLNPPYLKGVADKLLRNDTSLAPPIIRDTFTRLDGTPVEVEVTAIPFVDRGRLTAHLVIRDVSQRLAALATAQQAERRLALAEKMEAIGALAGGVAHEVNNMMLVVMGVSDILLRAADIPEERRRDLRDIKRAGERAAAVTSQLLAFGRRAAHAPQAVDLDALVRECEAPIRQLVGDAVQLTFTLGGPLDVHVDRGQVTQVLVQLALNARDAMPAGGALAIATTSAVVGPGSSGVGGTAIPEGSYARLSVRDTGAGVDPGQQARMFEPFFTTKPPGLGTGLGLAAVWGMMEQNSGYVTLESLPGHGTTFHLLFPLLPASVLTASSPRLTPEAALERAPATILVVDDEPDVLGIIGRFLAGRGFHVLLASDGAVALEMVAREGPPHLVLTDLMMPGIGGAELARRLGVEWPRLPILFMSGYSTAENAPQWGIDPAARLIQKPFALDELVRRVEEELALSAPATAAPTR